VSARAASKCVRRDLGRCARQGEAAGDLAGNTVDGRQAGEGATRCRARVHPCCVRHGAWTAGRGPAPVRAGSRSGARERGRRRGVLKQLAVALFD
jgi:hypothetical protein